MSSVEYSLINKIVKTHCLSGVNIFFQLKIIIVSNFETLKTNIGQNMWKMPDDCKKMYNTHDSNNIIKTLANFFFEGCEILSTHT